MDFEPHNFPAIVASVIRSDPRLAEPLKDIFAAYARNEDLEEIWARIDSKFHQPLRLILDDLNEIDDPVSLDQEVQVLLHAIDQALSTADEESMATEAGSKAPAKKARKPAGQKKKTVKKPAAKKKAAGKGKKKAAKKAVKKAAAPKKKKAAKPAKKKTAAPKKKKAGKAAAKKAIKKSPASKKAKPARKKKK